MSYKLLPFRFDKFNEDEYFLSNEVGEFIFLPKDKFGSFVNKSLDVQSDTFLNLKSKQIATDTEIEPVVEMLSVKYRTKKSFLNKFTALHMVVPTLRCNSNCIYCQVSRKDVNAKGIDIEKAAGEYMDKLRKKSESECVKEKVSTGLDIDSALKACKEGKDPFAFLKNAEGIPLAQGGKIDVLSDIFKRINIPDNRKDFVKSVVGETTITSSQIENNKGEKSIYKVNDDFRSETSDKFLSLLDEYLNSKTVSADSLKDLSLHNNPVTEEQIRDIALMPKAKQYIAASKISSDIAYFKTISQYRQAMDDLLEAMRAPGLDDVQRGVLERDYNYLKEKLERFKEERQIYKDYNEAVAGILSESEKEKLNTIINDDGTSSYFSDSSETQDKNEMYLPVTEESQ